MTDAALSPAADARRLRFRPVLILLSVLVGVSLAMELVLVVQSLLGAVVEGAVWGRCSILLAATVVLLLLAIAAARGSRRAWVRVRVISVVGVIAVAVIVSIPGFLPPWVDLEQGVCGALLLPVAILANLPRTGALFPKRA